MIPTSVSIIGNDAFKGCTNLTGVWFAGAAPTFGTGVFTGDTNVTCYYVSGQQGWPVSGFPGGSQASRTMSSSWGTPLVYDIGDFACSRNADGSVTIEKYSGSATNLAIPSALGGRPVSKIGSGAFDDNKTLIDVTVPSSVTSIGVNAFAGCTGLTSVAIPSSVTSIGLNAFAGCTGLISVAIPSSVTSIGNAAFAGCTGLISVAIPSSVTSIGNAAFADCTGLTSVAISSGVTSIGTYAFAGCTNLMAVFFNGNKPATIGTGLFDGVTATTTVYRRVNATGWGKDLEGKSVVTGSAGLWFTTAGAIHYTSINATEVMIDRPFALWGGITGDLVIPDEIDGKPVTQIGGVVRGDTFTPFVSQPGLTSVVIPASVKSIEIESFSNCTNLRSVTFAPGSPLTEIKRSTFLRCANLTEINLPAGLKTIGDSAFEGCGLSSVVIPATVTSIGKSAFLNCRGLESVYFLGACPTLGDEFVFSGSLTNNANDDQKRAVYCLSAYQSSFTSFPFGVTVASAPTDVSLLGGAIEIGNDIGKGVGFLQTTNGILGNRFTYSLVTGAGSTDNGSFTISNDLLKANVVFTAAATGSRSIRVRSTDLGGLFVEKTFTIRVTPVNHAPTDIKLSSTAVAENAVAGVVGTLSTTDQDAGDTFIYTLVNGIGSDNNDSFTIQDNQLQTTAAFDFESKNSYTIRVMTTDQDGKSYEKQFTISVTNVNDAPSVTSVATVNVAENQTAVQTVTGTDPDAATTLTYSISGGADAASFAMNPTTGALTFQSAPNFESPTDSGANNVYDVTVRVSDGTLTATKAVAVTVTNVNEAPTVAVPATFTVTEDVNGNLPWPAALTPFADVDSPSLTVTLAVTDGTISAASTANVTVGGSVTARTFTGTSAGLNAYFKTLGAISYTTAKDNTVARTLTTTVSDGSLSASAFTTITITPVNDAPTINPTALLGGGKVGTAYEMTYETLRTALNVADVDNASPSIVIDSVNLGTVQKWNGRAWATVSTASTAALAQRTLSAGGKIRWLPPAGVSGDRLAFKAKAYDGSLYSAGAVEATINLVTA